MQNTGTLKVTTPTECEVRLVRTFNAPRHLVHDALTRPELIRRWYGPHGFAMTACDVDLRVGGKYRFAIETPDGRGVVMYGEFVEINPEGHSIRLERMEGQDGHCVVVTTLTEENGRTTMNACEIYPSPQVRDFVISVGMEHGAAESYDRLAEMLALTA